MMEESKWIKTEQMLENLRNNPDVDYSYSHWLGGILRSTHFLLYDSSKDKFGDSMDWKGYDWYTEAEFLNRYAGHWWMK